MVGIGAGVFLLFGSIISERLREAVEIESVHKMRVGDVDIYFYFFFGPVSVAE